MNLDEQMMRRAFELARNGLYSTHPNPRVGCVIVRDGNIVGEGFHRRAGCAHAEVEALKIAGSKAQGATAYVSLEPCSHFGKTPPCTHALIAHGIKRVVAATEDPNPLVSGNGLRHLREAGIEVLCPVLPDEARALNPGFFSCFTQNRPFVRLKIAQSLDGKSALKNGISQWISNEKSRQDVQHWRAQSSAILTGINTVLADNPRLSVRTIKTDRPPVRIVLDTHGRMPHDCHLLSDHSAPTWWVHSTQSSVIAPDSVHTIAITEDKNGQINLSHLMYHLAQHNIREILCETGATLSGALIRENLVDELLIYQAPIILGNQARNVFVLPEITSLQTASRWKLQHIKQLDGDLRMSFTL